MYRLPQFVCFLIFALLFTACQEQASDEFPANFHVAGAMKNVMWKGELGGIIQLDTINNKEGLFAVGPLAYLRGEITVFAGQAFSSRVGPNDSLIVEENWEAAAPFLVYANQTDWRKVALPAEVKDLASLEAYVSATSLAIPRPFVFRLSGRCQSASIHCQNLAPGSVVSSPKEAHAGQVSYAIENRMIDLVGFYSTEHKGVFTHHDTNIHAHLLTQDRTMMGHLDALTFAAGEVELWLPEL